MGLFFIGFQMPIITEFGDGVQTVFQLPNHNRNATATVGGVTTALLSQAAGSVTFAVAPASGALVAINYNSPSVNMRTPTILSGGGLPVGIPSSGSIGNNGALTLTTALALVYSTGIYLYFPTGAIFSGSTAGLYFCIMSSTTVGTVYNNTYTTGQVIAPLSPTAFVTTGPGAYSQVLTAVTCKTTVLPAGTMGISGGLHSTFRFQFSNSATSKTMSLLLGATPIWAGTRTTTTMCSLPVHVVNRGVANRQVEITNSFNGSSGYAGATTGSPSVFSADTATDLGVSYVGQLTSALDYIILEAEQTEVLPG